MAKNDRFIALNTLAGVALLAAGLFGLDRVIATYLQDAGYQGLRPFVLGTLLLDTVTGKDVSKFLLGLLMVAGAVALLVAVRTRALGRNLMFVALVQLLSTLVTGVSKNLFGRLRPYQLLESGDWSRSWFMDGSSFPSGHGGFYFGLFLPLCWCFPRWRWPLVLAPWFIGAGRVDVNDHFMSDVGASIVVAGCLTLALARWMKAQPT